MKIVTDIEQSKKLANILDEETADMWYWEFPTAPSYNNYGYPMFHKGEGIRNVPAWSLSALMDALPHELIFELKSYRFKMCTDVYNSGEKYYDLGYQSAYGWLEYEDSTELVDACYKLIVALHERGLI